MLQNQLISLTVKNFRSLANVSINTERLTVLFGPNGAGKSAFLEALWFVRDCGIRGVDLAASDRGHGIGLLWEGASDGAFIEIGIETPATIYEILFGYSSGRIETFVGEKLSSKTSEKVLINRKVGSDKAIFYGFQELKPNGKLIEPEKPSLTRYIDFLNLTGTATHEVAGLDQLLRGIRYYHARSANFYKLRTLGSESRYETRLSGQCDNLWSILRNLHDKQVLDTRYDTIMGFMKESFPSFKALVTEQTGLNSVYASFIDKYRRKPIQASGISDGQLQMLIQLTALFSEEDNSLILLDEPDLSLHPWALSVLAKAIETATLEWKKQVVIATHSPVLMNQFEPEYLLAVELDDSGQTVMKRVSEIENIQDLLEDYATGSLYMAEMIAPQSETLPMPMRSIRYFRPI
jgi:predicted ATPase